MLRRWIAKSRYRASTSWNTTLSTAGPHTGTALRCGVVSASPIAAPARWSEASRKHTDDPHLRSTSDVIGHSIQALDGEIGHIEDFVVDDETWVIRYLVVDTKNWCRGSGC
jgi:hypothetical protein